MVSEIPIVSVFGHYPYSVTFTYVFWKLENKSTYFDYNVDVVSRVI